MVALKKSRLECALPLVGGGTVLIRVRVCSLRRMPRITPERLQAAAARAGQAAREAMCRVLSVDSLPDDLVTCRFVGSTEEDAPLVSLTRVLYEWGVKFGDERGTAKHDISVSRALRAAAVGFVPPWERRRYH